MSKPERAILMVLLLALATRVAFAGEDKKTEIEEKIKVVEKAEKGEKVVLPLDEARENCNFGISLCSLPGVTSVRRSQSSAEPVIRGLGWERVQTHVDGAPQFGACPGRMDPPITQLDSRWVTGVEVVKGLGSVTLGPGGTGGHVLLTTDYDRGENAGRELEGWLFSSYLSERNGYEAGLGVQGGTSTFDYRAGISQLDLKAYDSPYDIEVPSEQNDKSGFVSFGYRPSKNQRIYFNAMRRKGGYTEYPALPMNADYIKSNVFNFGYRASLNRKDLREIEVKISTSDVDHLMSNRGKPNRSILEAETNSSSKSVFASINSKWRFNDSLEFQIGMDFTDLMRDALRERVMVSSGMQFYDHIWPDVGQQTAGYFTEANWHFSETDGIRLGVRLDQVQSSADAILDPSIGQMSILEQWKNFNQTTLEDINRTESLLSANLSYYHNFTDHSKGYIAVGNSNRAASMTERYYAFAPAPNGYLVGNPGLNNEEKLEAQVGYQMTNQHVVWSLSVFQHRFNQFILNTTLGRQDVNGDGVIDTIRGFQNIDANLEGGETTLEWMANRWITIPISLAYVKGTNRTDHKALPEIPPLEGQAAIIIDLFSFMPGSIEFGGRFVGRQNRIDEAFGEDSTPGFSVYHLKAKAQVGKSWNLVLNVQNLFDKNYYEHLFREAALPVGDLMKGDEIPQPQRSFHVSIEARF